MTKFGFLYLGMVALQIAWLPTGLSAQPAAFPSTGAGFPLSSGMLTGSETEDQESARHPSVRARTDEDAVAPPSAGGGASAQAPQAAPAGAPLVVQVEILGASADDVKKAKRVLETREGEPLAPNKQRNDIRHLYELGIFRPNVQVNAEPVAGGVRLVYQVEPNPKVHSITVSGNQQIATNKIVAQLPVKAGEVYSVQAQNKLRDSVADYYEQKGFSDAGVRVEERPSADGGVDLFVTVDEGSKMLINDLIVRGNQTMGQLPIKFRAHNKGSFGPLKHYYNETKFQEDLQTIQALYLSRGYLDAEVRRGEFIYAPDQSWVSPVIEIQEGPRYRIGRVDARGYSLFSRDEVLGPFQYLEGNYYDLRKFASCSDKVKNMYGDEGFLLCQVEPDFRKDPSRAVVDVDVGITEGPRIYVGDVKIVSQSFPDDTEGGWLRRFYSRFSPAVKDEVVQREVRLRPGQVYRRFQEARTRERLKSLSVFDNVKVHDELSADANVRNCVVDVTQGDTGNLIFGVGFGDVEGAFIYANFIEHNLFGLARDLRVSGVLGSRAVSFDVSYLDRFFMGRELEAEFGAFHHNYLRTGDFRQMETGVMAEFTRPLSDCLRDAFRVRLASIRYDFDEEPKAEINDYVAATVRYRLMRDTRDDCFFPTSGHLMNGSIETGSADGLLVRFEGQFAKYFCLGENWVLASNNQVGLLPYKAEKIGYGERFFLGGSQDLRGFRIAGAGPHDSREEDIPLGGATKLLTQQELRYPFADCVTGVVFADAGMLSERPFALGSPRVSTGVGARLRLPIAQVAVDLALPVVRKSEDQTQIFHFTLSSRF